MKLTIQISEFPTMTANEVVKRKTELVDKINQQVQQDLGELHKLAKKLQAEVWDLPGDKVAYYATP